MTGRTVRPLPWLDRAGRLSPLKLAVFLACLAPALYLAGAYRLDALGAKPITALIHATGEWTVRFLLASLAVSLLRRIGDWPRVLLVRRMLGVTALAYALAHLALYVVDQNFVLTKVVSEIVLRLYLTIGFVALVGLIALGATSTDAAIRNLGPNWHRLHRLVYTIAVLGLAHYFLQSKIDVSDPVFWTGLFLLLMGWRVMRRFKWPERPWSLLLLAAGAALLTAGLEAAWYGLASGVPASLVLGANLDFSGPIRPAWWVLAVGLSLPVLALLRGPRARASGTARPAPVATRRAPQNVPQNVPLSPRA
ncbi:ferric reductase-like transmembrane domain-containing protein [Methylobacterium sp. NEAU 140]|uniref:sulfite oxidase heme-binding subunit YedZ n=1 Tax=Methylobacterium sp. NEAU 140 TaxID=3064945 RepID=UPI002736C1EE|nr:ferric reductase-like transmembrane domain-containing protein [Methylobacterium sp. NEAU 140]MDP4025527.1 ferric reductase-like transmembrane domain-containing protein [Methylobacterium sp. NEAU 140]